MNHNSLFETLKPILANFANRTDFHSVMVQIFGNHSDIDTLRQQWLNQSWTLPPLEILPSSILNGANGGYAESNQTIYLS